MRWRRARNSGQSCNLESDNTSERFWKCERSGIWECKRVEHTNSNQTYCEKIRDVPHCLVIAGLLSLLSTSWSPQGGNLILQLLSLLVLLRVTPFWAQDVWYLAEFHLRVVQARHGYRVRPCNCQHAFWRGEGFRHCGSNAAQIRSIKLHSNSCRGQG